MGTYSESIGHSVKRHGLLASVLTAAAVLGLVFLYRILKSISRRRLHAEASSFISSPYHGPRLGFSQNRVRWRRHSCG